MWVGNFSKRSEAVAVAEDALNDAHVAELVAVAAAGEQALVPEQYDSEHIRRLLHLHRLVHVLEQHHEVVRVASVLAHTSAHDFDCVVDGGRLPHRVHRAQRERHRLVACCHVLRAAR